MEEKETVTPAPETTPPDGQGVEAPPAEPTLTPFERKMKELEATGAGDEPDELEDQEEEEGAPAGELEETPAEEEKPKEEKPAAKFGTELELKLPGRVEGETAEFKIPVKALEEAGINPEEFFDRIQQLNNGYVRSAKLKKEQADWRAEREEIEAFRAEIERDPVAVVVGGIKKVEVQQEVAIRLLEALPEAAYNAVLDQVDAWAKTDRSAEFAKAELKRRQEAEAKAPETEQQKAIQKRATELADAVTELMPEEWTPEQQEDFFDDAALVLRQHVKKTNAAITAADVPGILEDRGLLGRYKVPPLGGKPANTPPKAGSGKSPKERARARVEAAAVPVGAGAAGAGGNGRPPKGLTGEQKIEWLKSNPIPTRR